MPNRVGAGQRDIWSELKAAIDNWTRGTPAEEQRQADARYKLQDELSGPWADRYKLVRSTGKADWQRLLPKKIAGAPDRLPADDHNSLWLRDGKPAVWVSQPYPLVFDDIAKMTDAARAYDLKFHIDTYPAWHYPGSVLFVPWTRQDFVWS